MIQNVSEETLAYDVTGGAIVGLDESDEAVGAVPRHVADDRHVREDVDDEDAPAGDDARAGDGALGLLNLAAHLAHVVVAGEVVHAEAARRAEGHDERAERCRGSVAKGLGGQLEVGRVEVGEATNQDEGDGREGDRPHYVDELADLAVAEAEHADRRDEQAERRERLALVRRCEGDTARDEPSEVR